MNISRHFWVALLVVSSTSCAANGASDGPRVGREGPQREVVVENWTGIGYRVYAFFNGDFYVIGTSRPMETSVLRIPDSATGTVILVTRELGTWDTRHASDPIHVYLGQRVKWALRATGGSDVNYSPPTLAQRGRPGTMGSR